MVDVPARFRSFPNLGVANVPWIAFALFIIVCFPALGAVNDSSQVPVKLQHSLFSPSVTTNDRFGQAVTISGSRVLVSATDGYNYLFDLTSSTPTLPVATFEGNAAIDGTRVVAVPSRGNSASVYDLSSTTPTVPVTTLSKPSTSAGVFGASVAVSGTVVAVSDFKRAYVYDLASTSPGEAKGDFPAFAVAASGNRVVAAVSEVSNQRACVYDVTSMPPTLVATLTQLSPLSGRNFAYFPVAISGTIVVMGPSRDSYLFSTSPPYVHVYESCQCHTNCTCGHSQTTRGEGN